MKKIFGFFASMMLMAGLLFVSCSKENLATVTPDEEDAVKTYTLTITASKEKMPSTKYLELDPSNDKIIYSKWNGGESISVYKETTKVGTLTASISEDPFNATLSGSVTGVSVGDELILQYGNKNYSSQNGTLEDISAKCDYAEATIKVKAIDGSNNITPESEAMFRSQQAIVKFILKNKNGGASLPVTKLTVKASGMSDVIVTPTSATDVLYVALAGVTSKGLVLRAEVGSDIYTYQKSSVNFANSKFYGITVSMRKYDTSTPLTLEAKENGTTVTFTNYASNAVKYVKYNASAEQVASSTIASGATGTIGLDAGYKVTFAANATNTDGYTDGDNTSNITCDKDCYVYGNVMSLINKTFTNLMSFTSGDSHFQGLFKNNTHIENHNQYDLILPATTLSNYCYKEMFRGCTKLTRAPELPATSLTQGCYSYMFSGCTNLTSAPAIPATSVAQRCCEYMFSDCTSLTSAPSIAATDLGGLTAAPYCYAYMFSGCTSLTQAPALPATRLTSNCYTYMFSGCTSLTQAPVLPATTLQTYCYSYMFHSCTSLETAPALPATTLATYCYEEMFYGCTKLTQAPVLPATTLRTSCYQKMFYGCTKLNYVKCLATDLSASYCLYNWIYGVASNGTFVKDASTTWPSGPSGIPSGWNVEDAS